LKYPSQINTCESQHDALVRAGTRSSAGYAISGVGLVICLRHDWLIRWYIARASERPYPVLLYYHYNATLVWSNHIHGKWGSLCNTINMLIIIKHNKWSVIGWTGNISLQLQSALIQYCYTITITPHWCDQNIFMVNM